MLLILALSIGLPAVLSLMLTPLARRLAISVGAIDVPDLRKVHKAPIPRMGGLAVAMSFFISGGIVYMFFPSVFPSGIRVWPHFLMLLDSIVAVLFIGICDDLWTLKPGQKFAVQAVAGALVYLAGYKITFITNPFGPGLLNLGILGFPLTVLWVVGITNAFNLIDGLDGLAAGVAFISGLTILGVALLNGYLDTAVFAALLIGSVLGFLKYNFNPAKIFLGDSGSLFLGFMLSVISIRSSIKGTAAFSIIVALLALGLPVMDTLLAMARRFMRSVIDEQSGSLTRKLHSLFLPDRRHIHHQLLANGLSHRNAVLILYFISSAFGLCAFLVTASNLSSLLVLSLTALATIFMVRKLGYREMQLLGNGVLLRLYNRTLLKRRTLQMALDVLSVVASFYFSIWAVSYISLEDVGHLPDLFAMVAVCTIQLIVLSIGGLQRVDSRLLAIGDFIRLTKSLLVAVLMSMPLLIFFSFVSGWDAHLIVTMIMDFYFLGTLVVGSRVASHILNHLFKKSSDKGTRVLIYGADSSGLLVLQSLLGRSDSQMIPVGFLDDDPEMEGKYIDDYPIFGGHWRLESVLKRKNVSQIVLAKDDINPVVLRRIRKVAELYSVPIVLSQIQFKKMKCRPSAVDPQGKLVPGWQRPSWSVNTDEVMHGRDI